MKRAVLHTAQPFTGKLACKGPVRANLTALSQVGPVWLH